MDLESDVANEPDENVRSQLDDVLNALRQELATSAVG